MARSIERNHLRAETLPHAEVRRFPGDLVAQLQEAVRPAGNDTLTGFRGRSNMRIDRAREIETAFDWCIDQRLEMNARQSIRHIENWRGPSFESHFKNSASGALSADTPG